MNTSFVRRLRVVAAFMADYDRIGNKSNNRLHADGTFTLIDFGGAFGSEARGQHKPGEAFSPAIGAFRANDTVFEIMNIVPLRYFKINRLTSRLIHLPVQTTHPWRFLNQQDVTIVIEQMKQLTNDHIRNIVTTARYSKDSDREYMIHALIERRNTLIADLNSIYMPTLKQGEVPVSIWFQLVKDGLINFFKN